MGKIYMIGSQKGGTAKTTTTFNLAYCLRKMGKRVLAVDFDSQANLTTCFGVEDRQKGTGMHRIKTFKIDNSKIPLDMQTIVDIKNENGEVRKKKEILLIHFIIENYFEHTDLLCEYFQECY